MSTLDVARAIVSLQSTFPRFGMGMLWAWEIEINILKFAYLKVVSPRLNSERLPAQLVAQISGFILRSRLQKRGSMLMLVCP
ncbi:hypothetical protein RHMOL_Rhmol04G0178400 [Rhododendron molle]|uniref:Uncharacterized protein n=1 Tax=Rhododendron molle TaxID=49168 RepID=A0ACC0P1X6_RHOML|nr:hypothetical protein RHMOL_Rhmol04G0178400 [Rhododendron molle]